MVCLRSDAIRKHLAGIDVDARGDPAVIYTPDWNIRTYDKLASIGIELLRLGWCVIFDAKYDRLERRARLRKQLQDVGAPFVMVHLHAPLDVLQRRLNGSRVLLL
jgi:predicted kinase